MATQLGDLTNSVRMVQKAARCRLIAEPRQHRKSEPAVVGRGSRKMHGRLDRSPSASSSISNSSYASYSSLDSRLLNESIVESSGGPRSPLPVSRRASSRPSSAKVTLGLPRIRGHVRSGSLGSEKLFGVQQKVVIAKSESIVNLSEARASSSNPSTPVLLKKATTMLDFHQLEVRRSSVTGQIEAETPLKHSSNLLGSCTSIDSVGLVRSPSMTRKRLLSIQTAV